MNPLDAVIREELNTWQTQNKVQRLWASDATLWTNHDEDQWTGWLHVVTKTLTEIPRIESLVKDIQTAGFQHIVLLGMGGSSLGVAMLAETFTPSMQMHVLDSIDPQQIQRLEAQLDLSKTLFIVSSKSGSTLEPNILKAYFYQRLQTVLQSATVGDRFIAITDPGSTLEAMAKNEKFRAIFYGMPTIGGRYSVLSHFGMVPAGLLGIDVKTFLQPVESMMQACAVPTDIQKNNPGVSLGIALGVCAKHGKDKVTLVISPGVSAVGAWLEQLIAESTSKDSKGLIPIDGETLGAPEHYGQDRVFVYIRLTSAPDQQQDQTVALLEQAGYVVIRSDVQAIDYLGAELFKWEIATAVASSVLGVNPFDQPDVEASKVQARQFAQQAEQLPKLMADEMSLRSLLNQIKPGDYVCLSAFIDMSEMNIALLQKSRMLIRNTKKVATSLGFGPRFLHSTGQLHKGGPNSGVFLQITADYENTLPIPDSHYSFGCMIAAQAQGDFAVLEQRGRRVLSVHLGKDVQAGLKALYMMLQEVLSH